MCIMITVTWQQTASQHAGWGHAETIPEVLARGTPTQLCPVYTGYHGYLVQGLYLMEIKAVRGSQLERVSIVNGQERKSRLVQTMIHFDQVDLHLDIEIGIMSVSIIKPIVF